jgi:UDP-GlcNAc:undecaprenyl-phosphate GlcNAc-1-phosphate transferase
MPGTPYALAAPLTILSAVIAWGAISLILRTPLAAAFADAPGHRKVHSAPVPRVGGIAIVAAIVAATLVWHALSQKTGAPLPRGFLPSILAAAAVLGALGLLDDSRFVNVRVRHKLIASAALAAATVFAFGVYPSGLSAFGLLTVPATASKLLAALWIMGLINAYNLVDGLDGFAGTVSIISLLGIAAVAHILGCPSSAALSLIALGAALGFMAHNAPPAKVFMGDTGSCFLGYVIALLTIRAATLLGASGKAPAVIPLLVGIPILELAITVARRYLGAQRKGVGRTLKFIVTADRFHLHHRFLLRGFSHLDACILAGTLSATIVGAALCAALTPLQCLPWIAAYTAIPVAVCLQKLGFGQKPKTPAGQIPPSGGRRLFYADLITQAAFALPVFAFLIYSALAFGP